MSNLKGNKSLISTSLVTAILFLSLTIPARGLSANRSQDSGAGLECEKENRIIQCGGDQ